MLASRIIDYTCTVSENRVCGPDLYLLRLKTESKAFLAEPGQFVMLDLLDNQFFFRRPFSVMQVHQDGSFDILYKVTGTGTRMMADFRPGMSVAILGPLGVGFPVVTGPTLLIGGGIGIAPVYFAGLGQSQTTCFYGVRSQVDLGILSELTNAFSSEQCFISTDDGSYGFHGHVGQLLQSQAALVSKADTAFICGPTSMMRAVSQLLIQINPDIQCYVSLEEPMPCGVGACTSCVVARTPAKDGSQRLPVKTCVEGPVLLASDVDWLGSCWA